MFHLLLGAGTVVVHTAAPVPAESTQPVRKILTAADFVNKEVVADYAQKPTTLWVQIHSNLPPYRFDLVQAPVRGTDEADDVLMGRIRILREGATKPMQTIEVWGADPGFFTTSFRMCDINFDGYLDLSEFRVAGGKWRSDSYWLFDPVSAQFVTNHLTAQLGELMYHGLSTNPKKREIRIGVWIGVCTNSFEVYRIERGKLRLVESELHMPEDLHHCVVKRRKWIGPRLVTLPPVRVKHAED